MRQTATEEERKKRAFETLSSRFCRACAAHVLGRDHHCVWIGSCVTDSGHAHFTAFLAFLLAALVQLCLLCLTSVCAENAIAAEAPLFVLAPSDCAGDFNGKFEGDAALAFVCGAHAAAVAVAVAALLAARVWRFASSSAGRGRRMGLSPLRKLRKVLLKW